MDIVKRAEMFATAAHKGANHKRKISGIDYIEHPKEVVNFTKHYMNILGFDEDRKDVAIAAAWLHDTVEDTGIEHKDILLWFGEDIAEVVFILTDHQEAGETREDKKLNSLRRLSAGSRTSHIVKLADIAANFEDIRRSHRSTNEKLQFKNYERFILEKRDAIDALGWVKDTIVAERILQDFDAFLALKEKEKDNG